MVDKNRIIIGSKGQFALEIIANEAEYKIGVFHLWINSVRLGRVEETYIKPNVLALSRINDLSNSSFPDINRTSVVEVFNSIVKNENLNDKTLLGFGETFDDYVLRPFIYNTSVVFLWTSSKILKLTNTKNIDIQFGLIEKKIYDSVMLECKRILNVTW